MYKKTLLFILMSFLFFSNTKAENLSIKTPDEEVKRFSIPLTQSFLPENAAFYQKNGMPVMLSSFKGKVIVLNFFKATCRKCLIEMPSLNELKDKYPDIVLLAVSEGDEDSEIIDRILHQERRLKNISVSLDDKQKLFFSVGGDKVPQTRLIDKKGMIRGSIKGQADFRSPEILKQIEELLNENP